MLQDPDTGTDPLSAARILIVDDEPGMRHFLVNTLRPISRHVDSAEDAKTAEAMLATPDPGVVAHASSIFDELREDPNNIPVTHEFRGRLSRSLRWRLALMGRFKRWM